jgi:hypothetical protein
MLGGAEGKSKKSKKKGREEVTGKRADAKPEDEAQSVLLGFQPTLLSALEPLLRPSCM